MAGGIFDHAHGWNLEEKTSKAEQQIENIENPDWKPLDSFNTDRNIVVYKVVARFCHFGQSWKL